jgi:hypothetical protein
MKQIAAITALALALCRIHAGAVTNRFAKCLSPAAG